MRRTRSFGTRRFLRRGTQSPTPLILGSIEEQGSQQRSVGLICKVPREQGAPVSERTCRAWKCARLGERDLADAVAVAVAVDAIRAVRMNAKDQVAPESIHGRRKVTSLLRRHDVAVPKRQIDRLMRELGINDLVRGKSVQTTVPDRHAARVFELVQIRRGQHPHVRNDHDLDRRVALTELVQHGQPREPLALFPSNSWISSGDPA